MLTEKDLLMEETKKKPDYVDSDWSDLITDRLQKWENMWKVYEQEGKVPIPLWEKGNFREVHREGFIPQMLVYPVHAGKPRGMFIICAGGGFMFKSDNEARPVADYFYKSGLNVAILDYNTDSTKMIGDGDVAAAAGEDGMRAVRMVRYHAKEWNINPDKIAIGGFSAGGVVSGKAGTLFDYGNPEADDPIERVSSRPDAVLLIYSAFTANSVCAKGDNRGYSFDAQRMAVQSMRNDINLRLDCPPFFIAQTGCDDPRDSYYMGIQLANRGIPHEVHMFEDGPHGGGLYDGNHEDSPLYAHTSMWASVAADWLKMKGFDGSPESASA